MNLVIGETQSSPQSRAGARRARFRPDIQALRAVAVTMVVLTHLWPNRLTGGYVGVDVFFVISGFLITSHLAKEIFGTSALSFGRFYARRIKRLLPAAFIVLAAGSVAVAIWVPYSEWQPTAREVMASAFYVENWSLAGQSIDYSAINNQATIAQHYWSLSVEEQFYFLWPLALFGLYRLGARLGARRRTILTGITLLGAASLVYSIIFTAGNPNPAYFVTPVRVWEFAAGGILAIAAAKVALPRLAADVLAVLGWLAIAASALTFSPQTEFPGWSALLPVIGATAVIAGGTGRTRVPFHPFVAWKPVQFVGDVSYSIYLWHWPMIVVAPYVLLAPLNAWVKIGIIAVCVPLAWLTKVLVEDRGKSWKILGQRPRGTFLGMGAGLAMLAILAGGMTWGGALQESRAEAVQEQQMGRPCLGPAALPAQKGCTDALGPAAVTVMGPGNRYYASAPECATDPNRKGAGIKAVAVCDFSGGKKGATTVWLTGDSHAEQWKPALLVLARKNHWKLTYSLLGGCPVADVTFAGYRGKGDPAGNAACMAGARSIANMIAADKPDKVFYSVFARKETVDDGSGRSQDAQYRAGLPKFWGRWAAAGSTVYVMADPPLNGYVRDPQCVALNPARPLKCAVPRAVAQPADPLVSAARSMKSPKVKLIDLTDHFCDSSRCYAVVGNVAVYYDADHLNGDFSKLLAPYIERQI
ncbi:MULTISPECIES: acyltransferase family protein [unclassified Arthrobacter]|uniref:acyltransferase family protein n=1 Tax=unclassified Arthrobacter TaxID=235627 RepID=UPI00159DFB46|nr:MULTISPECIES: acyltransferase family protein [unclassified Arthrobacter]MCQ9163032.1 acyltransferase [Arthrobacter sp. STN4]NVM97488.1 acyltransferase [Arthrobacter sp. SDTb3-6]